jgi:hypothetical protein
VDPRHITIWNVLELATIPITAQNFADEIFWCYATSSNATIDYLENLSLSLGQSEFPASADSSHCQAEINCPSRRVCGCVRRIWLQMIYFFSPQKHTFSPQAIFYPLFFNEGIRIRKTRSSKLHFDFKDEQV